jgi:hypothetical protein
MRPSRGMGIINPDKMPGRKPKELPKEVPKEPKSGYLKGGKLRKKVKK